MVATKSKQQKRIKYHERCLVIIYENNCEYIFLFKIYELLVLLCNFVLFCVGDI